MTYANEQLTERREARAKEVQDYDINIGTLEAAIAEINDNHPDDPVLAAYRDSTLALHLEQSQQQRAIANLLLTALDAQIAAMP